MRLYPIKTDIVRPSDDIVNVILESLDKAGRELEDDDVLVLTSKIVAVTQGRTARLEDFKPSQTAKKLARDFSLDPRFAEIVLTEADEIYGGVEKALLTLKNGILTANAGIDRKNAPLGSLVLWPRDLKLWADNIRKRISRETDKHVAILIVDSGLSPLRLGTNGLALAVAGFKPVTDLRGGKDLFEKALVITQHALADDLASAAHSLMGEAAEKTPIVLIKDAPIILDDKAYGSSDMTMLSGQCIFMSSFHH